MSTCYTFVCETCKQLYDIDKSHNACYLVPNLLEIHKRHDVFAYDDNNDDALDRYEGNISEPAKVKFEIVKVWDVGSISVDFRHLSLKWDESQFYHWLYALKMKGENT